MLSKKPDFRLIAGDSLDGGEKKQQLDVHKILGIRDLDCGPCKKQQAL